LERNSIELAYSLLKASKPENWEDFQIVIIPPEAHTEGKNSKASKLEGQNF
jgi:hypothetical protein